MADFNNLLADLDDNTTTQDDDVIVPPSPPREEVLRGNDDEPEIPVALAKAQEYQDAPTTTPDDDLEDDDDAVAQDADYAKLKKLWTQEMLSPELLPYDHDTISLELELVHGQEEMIDNLADDNDNVEAIVGHIYKMDLERAKYVASDLLETRLGKLEQHALHNRELVHRMSDNEVSYLKSYGELLEKHLRRTVLDHLPQDVWKKLDEPHMITSPDVNKFVFCKALEEVQLLQEGDGQQAHSKGSCLIARYETVQSMLSEGKMELLM